MKKLLIANLKSNKSVEEANQWLAKLFKLVHWDLLKDSYEVAVAPAFPAIEEFHHRIKEAGVSLKLVSQDISAYPAGSYTGATSFRNLDGLDISYAIVGHSERRRYFSETSAMVAKKVEQALENGITPLLCIDEPYLEEQMALIDNDFLAKSIICYEPLSAIGSGKNLGVAKVEAVKQKVKQLCGDVPFLYGGSVTDQNVAEYLIVTDGVLVGSFSLEASKFAKLVNVVLE